MAQNLFSHLYFCVQILIEKYIINKQKDTPSGDRYIGAPLAVVRKRGQIKIIQSLQFLNNDREMSEVEATKPQAASYASTSQPLPASQVGDKSKRKEVRRCEDSQNSSTKALSKDTLKIKISPLRSK